MPPSMLDDADNEPFSRAPDTAGARAYADNPFGNAGKYPMPRGMAYGPGDPDLINGQWATRECADDVGGED
jgi:hypothetical protein